MTSTATIRSDELPRLRPGTGLRLVRAGAGRWRVLDLAGRIIGHLDAREDARGLRYRARRYHAPSRAFLDLGGFWSADDAVDALRFGR